VKGISVIQLMTTQRITDSKGRRSVSLHRDYIGLRLRVAHRRAITYTHVAPKTAPADVMDHLTRNDYACALGLLATLEAQARQPDRFARACVDAMRAFLPAASIQFDMGERRMPRNRYVVELALSRMARIRVERRSGAFSARDRQRMELLQPHLAFLYRQACEHGTPLSFEQDDALLTPREREVMSWLSFGKTDADIAQLLQISPRTVHKHLEHIYVKLGVETRTAAVMRVRRLA
jgi:DNA-binding CsgD family transcriptional regulator